MCIRDRPISEWINCSMFRQLCYLILSSTKWLIFYKLTTIEALSDIEITQNILSCDNEESEEEEIEQEILCLTSEETLVPLSLTNAKLDCC